MHWDSLRLKKKKSLFGTKSNTGTKGTVQFQYMSAQKTPQLSSHSISQRYIET